MDKYIPTREETYKLLTKYVQDPSLINHALMVEAVMGAFCRAFWRGRR